MFGSGSDSANTDAFKCRGCQQPLFVLMDETAAGNMTPTQTVVLGCCRCHATEKRTVTPTMSEDAGAGEPIHPLPFQQLPQNALLCGNTGVAIGKLAPKGTCHGAVFRVLERGNELLSRCTACGKGDSIGMINGAVQ